MSDAIRQPVLTFPLLKSSLLQAACGRSLLGMVLALGIVPCSIDPVAASRQLVSIVFASAATSPHRFGADAFRDAAVKEGRGGIAIDLRGNSFVGTETMILAETQAGAVNMSVVSASVAGVTVPEIGVFDIPFLFRDDAHAKAVANGPVAAKIAAKFLDKGLVLLAIGKQGFRNVTNSMRPIRTPADIAGLKIRVIPNAVYQMTFKTLGAEVIPMDFSMVYAALKDGRIQAQENPIANIAASRLYDVQKYISLTGHFFAPMLFIANREFFESLDPVEQAALKAAAKSGADATWQTGARDAQGLDEIRKGGMQVIEQVDRQPFVDALASLEPEFEKRFGKDTLAAIRSTR